MKSLFVIFFFLPTLSFAQGSAPAPVAGDSSNLYLYVALGVATLSLLFGVFLFNTIRQLKGEISRFELEKNRIEGLILKQQQPQPYKIQQDKTEWARKDDVEKMHFGFDQRLRELESPVIAKKPVEDEVERPAPVQKTAVPKPLSQIPMEVTNKDFEPPVSLPKPAAEKVPAVISPAQELPKTSETPVAAAVPAESGGEEFFYAKLPDLDNGFSEDVILHKQNGEQIYELILNGEQGTFVITKIAEAQKYALSDFNYYLQRACQFDAQPTKNSTIVTNKPGTLMKSGANWIIMEKAQIEFR